MQKSAPRFVATDRRLPCSFRAIRNTSQVGANTTIAQKPGGTGHAAPDRRCPARTIWLRGPPAW